MQTAVIKYSKKHLILLISRLNLLKIKKTVKNKAVKGFLLLRKPFLLMKTVVEDAVKVLS